MVWGLPATAWAPCEIDDSFLIALVSTQRLPLSRGGFFPSAVGSVVVRPRSVLYGALRSNVPREAIARESGRPMRPSPRSEAETTRAG